MTVVAIVSSLQCDAVSKAETLKQTKNRKIILICITKYIRKMFRYKERNFYVKINNFISNIIVGKHIFPQFK